MPETSNCGADTRADTIFGSLKEDFVLPSVDLSSNSYTLPDFTTGILSSDPSALTNADLTTQTVEGSGTFDVLMNSVKTHLGEQYESSRITGDQYAKAYIELTAAAMGNSVQYLLGRDQAKWQAILSQSQAKRAEIEAVSSAVALQTAKAQLALTVLQSQQTSAEVALTKMKLATEDAQFCQIKAQTDQLHYQTENILPAQATLITEQGEVQRAQTMDTRSDGVTVINGSVGKQKDLYDQQIDSYVKDAQYKAGKMYLDAWITQKTLDEGLLAPNELTNATIDDVLADIRTNNNLG